MSEIQLGMPVAIVSVVGALRSGKSFLLSWFVRILGGISTSQGSLGGGNGKTGGFSWKGGYEPHTKGMMVWSKPFIREVDDGKRGRKEMAVLLVDTQGTFDHTMNTHLEACLFGLSTTLSSCQIFNVKNQVQTDNLGSLAVYLEYGTVANESQSKGGQDSEAPFQRLEVLIRDWQNWEEWDDPDKADIETLHGQFCSYLDDILGRDTASNEQINTCFRDHIGCFGLPNPGETVTWRDFQGDIMLIKRGFVRMVSYYIETVILGQLTAACLPNASKGQFVGAVGDWVKLFSDGMTNGTLPKAKSWLGMMNEAYNNKRAGEVFDAYEEAVDEISKKYVRQVDMVMLLEGAQADAMSSFKPKGTKEAKGKATQELRTKIAGENRRIQQANRQKATFGSIFVETAGEVFKFITMKPSKRVRRHTKASTSGKDGMAFFGTHVQNLKDTWDTSKGQPRPLQLVSVARKAVTNLVDEVTGWEPSFQLHEQNLKLVMSQVESDMPVAIVSVVGAFRSGKSFLLSCFLKSLEANESDGTFKEGVLGGKSGTKNGFSWKGGTEGHTQGMMVWSKPFIREVDDGKGGRTNMAVLLVDTQGTFDHKMNTHLEACLFGLSATLSSCQIFNVRNQVQADNLGSLAVYLEYGTVANDNKRGGGGQDHGAPFQRLEVLVRDWQNWKNPTDTTKVPCEELLDTFLEYLDDILEKATTDTNKVKSCFRDRVGCFGLPFPGPHVASVSFDGKISNIDEGFMRLVNYYVKDVILGKLKATNASNLSNRGGADEFIDSVKSWVQLFSDGLTNDKLPDADSWLGMVHASQNHNQMQKVLEVFKDTHPASSPPRFSDAYDLHLEEEIEAGQGSGQDERVERCADVVVEPDYRLHDNVCLHFDGGMRVCMGVDRGGGDDYETASGVEYLGGGVVDQGGGEDAATIAFGSMVVDQGGR
eukprot:g9097.t1